MADCTVPIDLRAEGQALVRALDKATRAPRVKKIPAHGRRRGQTASGHAGPKTGSAPAPGITSQSATSAPRKRGK